MIELIFEVDDYRISPYSGDTCWKIQERGDDGSKSEWKEARYFPSTFDAALIKVRELMRLQNKSTTDLDGAIKIVKELNKKLEDEVKSTKSLFPKAFE